MYVYVTLHLRIFNDLTIAVFLTLLLTLLYFTIWNHDLDYYINNDFNEKYFR